MALATGAPAQLPRARHHPGRLALHRVACRAMAEPVRPPGLEGSPRARANSHVDGCQRSALSLVRQPSQVRADPRPACLALSLRGRVSVHPRQPDEDCAAQPRRLRSGSLQPGPHGFGGAVPASPSRLPRRRLDHRRRLVAAERAAAIQKMPTLCRCFEDFHGNHPAAPCSQVGADSGLCAECHAAS